MSGRQKFFTFVVPAFTLLLFWVIFFPIRHGRPDSLAAKESISRGNLDMLRAALQTYREDKGRCPKSLDELIPTYLEAIPSEKVLGSSTVSAKRLGLGGWYFDPQLCEVGLNLDGNDRKGKPYSNY